MNDTNSILNHLKFISCFLGGLNNAKKEGKEEGRKEGRKEGEKIGVKKGEKAMLDKLVKQGIITQAQADAMLK